MAKAINLPPWNKLTVDWTHIADRHISGGIYASGRKSVFGQLSLAGVKRVVRGAYRGAKKIASQGDRVVLEGIFDGWKVNMWLDTTTKTLEAAFPVP